MNVLVDEKISNTKIGVLKNELVKMQFDAKMKDERLQQLEKKILFVEEHLSCRWQKLSAGGCQLLKLKQQFA